MPEYPVYPIRKNGVQYGSIVFMGTDVKGNLFSVKISAPTDGMRAKNVVQTAIDPDEIKFSPDPDRQYHEFFIWKKFYIRPGNESTVTNHYSDLIANLISTR